MRRQAFGSQGRSGTSHLWKSWQNKCGKRNFRFLPVSAEWKCGSRTSHIWQSMQSGSAEAELHIFGSQCRTKVRKWNFRSLAVKTGQKRNFRSLAFKIVRKRNIRSLAVKAEQKCGSGIKRSLAVKTEWKCKSGIRDL